MTQRSITPPPGGTQNTDFVYDGTEEWIAERGGQPWRNTVTFEGGTFAGEQQLPILPWPAYICCDVGIADEAEAWEHYAHVDGKAAYTYVGMCRDITHEHTWPHRHADPLGAP